MALVKYEETELGFEWGAMEFTRIGSNPPTGGVQVEIRTPKVVVNVYVTKTGRVVVSHGAATREALRPSDQVIRQS